MCTHVARLLRMSQSALRDRQILLRQAAFYSRADNRYYRQRTSLAAATARFDVCEEAALLPSGRRRLQPRHRLGAPRDLPIRSQQEGGPAYPNEACVPFRTCCNVTLNTVMHMIRTIELTMCTNMAVIGI